MFLSLLALVGCPTSDIPAGCGDGTLATYEECEGFELRNETCLSQGFQGGRLTCSPRCTFDVAQCLQCGDGVVSGDEVCDGQVLSGATCASLGQGSGDLRCGLACVLFDVSGCEAADGGS